MERETGLEPATATLATWGSTTELLPPRVTASEYLLTRRVSTRLGHQSGNRSDRAADGPLPDGLSRSSLKWVAKTGTLSAAYAFFGGPIAVRFGDQLGHGWVFGMCWR